MAKLTRLFGYQNREDEWVFPNEPEWDIEAWRKSGAKGPWIRPADDLVVIQQDPYPDQSESGLVLFASDNAVAEIMHPATVLAVGPGKWNKKGTRRQPIDLQSGDRVVALRVVAYNRIPDDYNQRLRIVHAEEIWGTTGEES